MRHPDGDGLDPTGLLVRRLVPAGGPPSVRKFSIGDLMIIVAGTALGCAWTRANWAIATRAAAASAVGPDAWQTTIQLPTPLLFALGIAALICRVMPPCPPWERVARQPGVIALAILAFVMGINATIVFTGVMLEFAVTDMPGRVVGGAPFLLPDAGELFIYQIIGAGPSVMVCWTLQIVMGWWEAERSWIDRLGRTLGVCLIVITVFTLLQWLTGKL